MKALSQLFRQLPKAFLGIILIMLFVSIFSVFTGQYICAIYTQAISRSQFNTVALPTGNYNETNYIETNTYSIKDTVGSSKHSYTSSELQAWIEQLIKENPELVKADSRPGLASAYISDLSIDNITQHDFFLPLHLSTTVGGSSVTPIPVGSPYTCALLEVQIDSVKKDAQDWYVIGTIEKIHSLDQGYNIPLGWTLRIMYPEPKLNIDPENFDPFDSAPIEQYEREMAVLEAFIQDIQVGQRYLVYGADYYNADWELRERIHMEYKNRIGGSEEVIIEEFLPENIVYLSEAEIERNKQSNPRYYDVARYMHGFKSIGLSERELSAVRSIWMTDPEIVLLEGAAEDFLASAEGAQWAEYLEYSEINSHAFPIIGVDKLGYIGNFAQETARIVDGRDFTQDELDNGAKVCIMAQSLAQANGLSVGDTINPRYYEFDPEMKGQYLVSDGWGTTNPSAYFYGANTPWAGDAEEYTIVGLYRCDNEWGDPQENLYSFTPNTIFVPKNSVTGTMDYGDQAFFRTIVLEHGAIPQFRQLVEDAGYEGLFVYYDQGYSEIADSLHDYEASARRAATIGAIVSGVLLLLFLFFFPARHGKTLAVMSSLGATRGRRYRYIVADTLCLLIPGTVLGCVAGLLLWKQVAAKLMSTAQFTLDVPSSAGSLLPSVLALFLFTLCLVLLLAVPLSKGKHPMKRK